jgi:glutamate N-acetyltransferase/amino-acid N-acetyltransferase
MNIVNNFILIKGFKACGIHGGIKKNSSKKDLMVLYSELPAVSGSVFTQNVACAAPILVSKSNSKSEYTQAVIVNSGNANACTGNEGITNANLMTKTVASELSINENEVIVASTGIIGLQLPIDNILKNIPTCVEQLSDDGFNSAAEAILTTDTFEKKASITFDISGEAVTISGMAKGSGMIHPNMATMLGFFITDVNITKTLLQEAVSESASKSFNMISVDGDTSTNDMVTVLANGSSGHVISDKSDDDFTTFKSALTLLMIHLAKMIAKDGEGATKLLEVNLTGAASDEVAIACSKAVVSSSLVKAAFFGKDANWGRIVCAMGYSGVNFDINKVDVAFKSDGGLVEVFSKGKGLVFDEKIALDVLEESTIEILINMNDGNSKAQAWGCDLTYEYVKINGEYRS